MQTSLDLVAQTNTLAAATFGCNANAPVTINTTIAQTFQVQISVVNTNPTGGLQTGCAGNIKSEVWEAMN